MFEIKTIFIAKIIKK